MKRIASVIFLCLGLAVLAEAQKIAFIDTEYILKSIPAYEAANDQLQTLSKRYEDEIVQKMQEVERLYEAYRTESVFLTTEMKIKKENEIVEKENAAKTLQQKYFGQDGELYKNQQTLVKPIQDQVYNAVMAVAQEKNYAVVYDKATMAGLMYADKSLDISDLVLKHLGYSK